MKKIIVVVLLSILVFAEHNATNKTIEENQSLGSQIQLLKNEKKELKDIVEKLTIEKKEQKEIIEKLTIENNASSEQSTNQQLEIKSIPIIQLEQPINWSMILLPIVTIFVVILSALATINSTNKKTKESINTFNETIKNQKELKELEIKIKNKKERINELRNEVTKLIVRLNDLSRHYEVSLEQEDDLYLILSNELNNIMESSVKIELYLNPTKDLHNKLVNHIHDVKEYLIEILNNEGEIESEEFQTFKREIIDTTLEIIENEWEKIKV